MSSPIAIAHLQELAERKSKTYEMLLRLQENPIADDSCFQSLARIVDGIQFNELSLEAGAMGDFSALVKSPADDLGSNLAVLALAFTEAAPDRARLQILLAGFPKWLEKLSDTARPHFLGILPNIAVHLNDLRDAGMNALIAAFNGCSSPEDGEILAGCIARYRETSGEIVAAAAEIASVAIRGDARALIEEMMTAVPPEVMLDSKEARALLPAIAKLKTASAIGVCTAVAQHNHSSALHLAQHFAGILTPLDPETQLAYLPSFRQIIQETGISLVAYGSKQLPALFQKAGVDRAAEFVAEGIAIARKYGKIAAQEFFEQKTAAAKQAYPLG